MGQRSSKAFSYRAYTTKFDVVVNADDLDTVLGPMTTKDREKLDEAWSELQSGLLAWKTKLHIASIELTKRICAQMLQDQREDAVVTLLFDQSGSMRGQKMLFSAARPTLFKSFLLA